ncbi:hypothetical protein ACFSGI_08915 [Paenibacillus nicotianae]|uniref:Uncharacterized protein n=1 Tax=Paenibacillus nicotianae TaxID=1526551 RepID=A0ABW4URN6_9BACL
MSDQDKVKAKTYWVWTELAERKNPAYSRTGYPVWDTYLYEAPTFMLTDGLIADASEVDGNEGQVTMLDLGV